MTSTASHKKADAVKEAWEEIFEGKVGALEITLTIPLSSSGRLIRQNTTAAVNIPDMGLSGLYFVVGCSLEAGLDGYRMVVRLRERNYAISRRVPNDPLLTKDPADQSTPGDVGDLLAGAGIRWATAFASAAQEFHGGWDYSTFLGILLAICHKESSFHNVREGGDVEWYAKPGTNIPLVGHPSPPSPDNAVQVWHGRFANRAGNPLNKFGREAGVGPMQLTTASYKTWADQYGGSSDEYAGGRWQPRSNIRAGARAFAGKLSGLDPQKAANIWIGVERYNGSGPAAVAYMEDVRKIYGEHYLGLAKSIDDQAKATKGGLTTDVVVRDDHGGAFEVKISEEAPIGIKRLVTFLLKQRGKAYQWGAEGPNTFDCSGLAVAAYAHIGVKLPGRTTYDFVKKGNGLPLVAKDELLAGDLVFFAKGGDVHHMGIYLNDGHFIHAPATGDVVKISALGEAYYRSQYYGARRVIQAAWRGN